MVEGEEHEGPQVETFPLPGIVNGAEDKVDEACEEEVVEIGQEGVFEFAVVLEGQGHFGPILGEVFKEVPVGIEFTALEAESLVVADGNQRGNREQREQDEERGGLEILLVEDFREGEEDEREQAECGFLAGLREEGEAERKKGPVLDRVAVIGPLENQKRERGQEYIEGFHRHGAELEKYGGL